MKAGAVMPGQKDSARIVEVEVPQLAEDEILVKILEAGIDGTDIEINRGQYGQRGLRSTPTLPLHTGHARIAVNSIFIADSLSSIYSHCLLS